MLVALILLTPFALGYNLRFSLGLALPPTPSSAGSPLAAPRPPCCAPGTLVLAPPLGLFPAFAQVLLRTLFPTISPCHAPDSPALSFSLFKSPPKHPSLRDASPDSPPLPDLPFMLPFYPDPSNDLFHTFSALTQAPRGHGTHPVTALSLGSQPRIQTKGVNIP